MILQVCPSKGKDCGIARYSRYVEYFLQRKGFEITTIPRADSITGLSAVLLHEIEAIVVQHEYGLFDGDINNSLWAGESTGRLIKSLRRLGRDLGIPVVVVMHTVNYTSKRLEGRTRRILDSGLRVVTLNPVCSSMLGIPFLEHGIPYYAEFMLPHENRNRGSESSDTSHLFHFGLLSALKRIELLLNLAEAIGTPLDANLAVTDREVKHAMLQQIERSRLPHRITFGFMNEAAILKRWRGRSGVFVSSQTELRGYYASSGSTRFAYNFDCPIVCTGYWQHLNLDAVDCVPEYALVEQVAQSLAAPAAKREAIAREGRQKSIGSVYSDLLASLPSRADQ